MSDLENKEQLPVSDTIKVIDYDVIYKTAKWWKVTALVNAFGHDSVVTYLWRWNEDKGKWTRKQKLGVKSGEEWEKIKASTEKFLPRMRSMRTT